MSIRQPDRICGRGTERQQTIANATECYHQLYMLYASQRPEEGLSEEEWKSTKQEKEEITVDSISSVIYNTYGEVAHNIL